MMWFCNSVKRLTKRDPLRNWQEIRRRKPITGKALRRTSANAVLKVLGVSKAYLQGSPPCSVNCVPAFTLTRFRNYGLTGSSCRESS